MLQIRTMLCWMLRLANVLFVCALQFLRKALWMFSLFSGDLLFGSVRGRFGSILLWSWICNQIWGIWDQYLILVQCYVFVFYVLFVTSL